MSGVVEAYYLPEHGSDGPGQVSSPEEMDAVIDALIARHEWDTSLVTFYHGRRPLRDNRWPDHQFRIAVNVETGQTGAVRGSPGSPRPTGAPG